MILYEHAFLFYRISFIKSLSVPDAFNHSTLAAEGGQTLTSRFSLNYLVNSKKSRAI